MEPNPIKDLAGQLRTQSKKLSTQASRLMHAIKTAELWPDSRGAKLYLADAQREYQEQLERVTQICRDMGGIQKASPTPTTPCADSQPSPPQNSN